MTYTVTAADVRTAFQHVQKAYADNNLNRDDAELVLHTGSPTYGTAYSLMWKLNDGGGETPATGWTGLLGYTRREAYQTLSAIADTLNLVRTAQENAS